MSHSHPLFEFFIILFNNNFTGKLLTSAGFAVWPDSAIYSTINLPKLPTYLSNFCKGVKIFHFSSEILFWQLYRHLATFYWSHCQRGCFLFAVELVKLIDSLKQKRHLVRKNFKIDILPIMWALFIVNWTNYDWNSSFVGICSQPKSLNIGSN